MFAARLWRVVGSARRCRVGLAVALGFLTTSCLELDDFDTDEESEYTGRVFGADPDDCDDRARCSFIRRGFGSDAVLHMRFDPDGVQSVAGSLSTTGEGCREATFTDVPLIAIEPLLHDQLSLLEIPGGARVKNYIFALSPVSGPLAGRDVVAFVSLLRSERIEVRVLAGSGQNACNPADCDQINAGGCDYFGVFSLDREEL
jgi:hypothetical protein